MILAHAFGCYFIRKQVSRKTPLPLFRYLHFYGSSREKTDQSPILYVVAPTVLTMESKNANNIEHYFLSTICSHAKHRL